jgi:hypothetical protein
MDSRDYSKEPKVLLDIDWVLTMRKRMVDFSQSGNMEWYKAKQKRSQG